MIKNKKGFTFVELIVSIIILTILAGIGFGSISGHISNSRDSERMVNLSLLETGLKSFKEKIGSLPFPEEYKKITNNGVEIAFQGKISKNVGLSTVDKIPYDPKLDIPYTYSVTNKRSEYEIAGTLENENENTPKSLVIGNYKCVAKNILPTILLATGTTNDIEIASGTIDGDINRKTFIFNNQNHNLVYDFEGENDFVTDGKLTFDELLKEAIQNDSFTQNSHFKTCNDVKEAKKDIGDGDYELRTNTGALTSSGCTF